MTKEVSLEEVRRLAQLSRLAINADEEKLFARQFGQILGHVEILANVDTDGIEPLYSPVTHPGWIRNDEARNIRDREEILSGAPETDGECFMVPRIV